MLQTGLPVCAGFEEWADDVARCSNLMQAGLVLLADLRRK